MIWQETQANKGVTLIELMIVLVIAAILVGGIYTLFATQQRSYFVQDGVAGIQQDARAVLTIMARDIRMAGLAVGVGGATGFTDGTTPFAISGFNFAVNPTNSDSAPDSLTVVLGVNELGTVQSIAGTLVTLDNNVASDNTFVAFDLQPGRLYQATPDGTNVMPVTNFPGGDTTVGGKAYGVKAITYTVTALDGTAGLGSLRRNENTGAGAQPLAGDGTTTFVEDLQFAYQVEGDAGWYNDPSTDFPAGTNQANIEMVRISINVRTAIEDATVADADAAARFDQPVLEDHTTTGLNTDDGFRRRVYTTVVKVRNL
jgi:prepilin-type N-terminal cleavage/methylation domain-containing protein